MDECLYFRPIRPQDRQQIQELHELWFPVVYNDDFYDTLVHGRLEQALDQDDAPNEAGYTPLYTNLAVSVEEERIVGCIVGAHMVASKLSDALRRHLQLHETEAVFYIMTLGVVDDYRGRGLARHLVTTCLQEECAEGVVVYLHVLDTNTAALRLYEGLQFSQVRHICNYYQIDGQLRNCYLYAKNAENRWSWLGRMTYAVTQWWRGWRREKAGVDIEKDAATEEEEVLSSV